MSYANHVLLPVERKRLRTGYAERLPRWVKTLAARCIPTKRLRSSERCAPSPIGSTAVAPFFFFFLLFCFCFFETDTSRLILRVRPHPDLCILFAENVIPRFGPGRFCSRGARYCNDANTINAEDGRVGCWRDDCVHPGV